MVTLISGAKLTLREIFARTDLRDTPCLEFKHDGVKCYVQNAHVTEAELLDVPGLADSQWRFWYETSEWIPVFTYADTRPITDLMDIAPSIDEYETRGGRRAFWVTPKGYPRTQ